LKSKILTIDERWDKNLIDTAVIPAAGLGTRFYPITEFIPKELLPVADKPCIHYIVKEACNAGIKNIVIIISERKKMLKDYFSFGQSYVEKLYKYCSEETFNEIEDFKSNLNFYFINQDKPLGLGHAILCAKDIVSKNPFAIMLPDDLLISKKESELSRMIKSFNHNNANYFTIKHLNKSEISSYGIISTDEDINANDEIVKINKIIEKPQIQDAPSDYGVIGRYIVNPEIFDAIKNTKPGALGEIQLTDSLNEMINNNITTYGYKIFSTRYDCGTPKGLSEATYKLSKLI
tara:strand:+ start:557 stop:1429 length:873 start_codon:yes stop_codon:yes gene_type:complete